MTSDSGRAPARARLATLMDARRRELRLTWDKVATGAGIHRETLRQIRHGTGDLRPLTITGLEDVLSWAHGSIDAIIEGGDPTPLDADDEDTVAGRTLADLAAELEEVKRRNSQLERRFEEFLAERRREDESRGQAS